MRMIKLTISSLALLSLLLASTAVMSAEEKTKPAAAPTSKVSAANVFNRLLKKEKMKNAPPTEDGIHDPANDGTHVLQPPLIAFEGLPTTEFGNYVNWVKALNDGLLNPRYDRFDPTVEPLVMDLDIVREVKASVPDVVFPHKPHTQWLHCSNCHPKIFIPQRNANVINMSAILLGQKCGAKFHFRSLPNLAKCAILNPSQQIGSHLKVKPALRIHGVNFFNI